ncbi:MAG: hypothetical protein IPM54_23900 [Polyangiaceae bacterium]|nr:hypothetical protein [Polyangiaceae bacterium]
MLVRMGRASEALERIASTRAKAAAHGGAAHRIRAASAIVEAAALGAMGRHEVALETLEKLQTALRWEEVCLDHPGDGYMRERRADVAWYLTIARDRARGVDELPSLLQAAEEEGDTRHARVHVRAAFELARHGRRLDDLGAHAAATACYDEAMTRLERAATRPPGDAAMLACAGLVAISRGATPRGIPLLRKAAEQGGTAVIQSALEAVHGEGFDAESIVTSVREAFDWIPRERMETLRAADALGVTLIRALVFPGKPPEPLLPPMTYPLCAGRFAVSTTPPLSGREANMKTSSAIVAATRLLLLEPPDGTTNDIDERVNANTGRSPAPSFAAIASWPQRLGAFAGGVDEIATALDGLFPKTMPIAAIVEGREGSKGRDLRFAVEIEKRDGGLFRLAILHDVHGHERHVFDGITLSHYREGHEPTVSRRGPTMLLALWRALSLGLAGAFDMALVPGGSPATVVVKGTPREPGTGVMSIELHLDNVLLSRKDPRALRHIEFENVAGVKHRFDIQAAVGKIELSLFGNAHGG